MRQAISGYALALVSLMDQLRDLMPYVPMIADVDAVHAIERLVGNLDARALDDLRDSMSKLQAEAWFG